MFLQEANDRKDYSIQPYQKISGNKQTGQPLLYLQDKKLLANVYNSIPMYRYISFPSSCPLVHKALTVPKKNLRFNVSALIHFRLHHRRNGQAAVKNKMRNLFLQPLPKFFLYAFR